MNLPSATNETATISIELITIVLQRDHTRLEVAVETMRYIPLGRWELAAAKRNSTLTLCHDNKNEVSIDVDGPEVYDVQHNIGKDLFRSVMTAAVERAAREGHFQQM